VVDEHETLLINVQTVEKEISKNPHKGTVSRDEFGF
jgi:hypothetical protein